METIEISCRAIQTGKGIPRVGIETLGGLVRIRNQISRGSSVVQVGPCRLSSVCRMRIQGLIEALGISDESMKKWQAPRHEGEFSFIIVQNETEVQPCP